MKILLLILIITLCFIGLHLVEAPKPRPIRSARDPNDEAAGSDSTAALGSVDGGASIGGGCDGGGGF